MQWSKLFAGMCTLIGLAALGFGLHRERPRSVPATAPVAPTSHAPAGVPRDDWQTSTFRRIIASEYGVRQRGEHFDAANRAQHLHAEFASRGAKFSDQESGRVAVQIRPVSLRRGAEAHRLGPAQVALGDCNSDGAQELSGDCLRRVELRRPELKEIWENRPEGLEQLFVVSAPPRGHAPLELLLAVENASVSVAPDGTSADLSNGEQGTRLRYGKPAACDADGHELPIRLASAPGGMALVIRDAAAKYPITIDPPLTNLAWSMDGDQGLDSFGLHIAGAGDVNGDGFDDVLVAAPSYAYGGHALEGRVFLFLGAPTEPLHTPAWSAGPNQALAFFGSSVAAAGDVDGDGKGDVIIGAPGVNTAFASSSGAAYVYLGTSTGLTPLPVWTTFGGQAGAHYGAAVAGAGDVNGDGLGDVIVGAPDFDNAGTVDAGLSGVFLGIPGGGPDTNAAWGIRGSQASEHLGKVVASVGDVNCDGKSDFIVGSPTFDGSSGVDAGRAQIFLGGSPPSATAFWHPEGTQAGEQFGASVASAGVQHLLPSPAVAVGAPFFDDGQIDEGAVFVFRNDACSLSSSPNWTQEGNFDGAGFGFSLASAGDVNGDGFGDLLVGEPGFNSDEGRVVLYMGRLGGPSVVGAAWRGNSVGVAIGSVVAGAGDVNGDGFADMLLGSPNASTNGFDYNGRVLLYSGAGFIPVGNPVITYTSSQANDRFGWSVASAGDVDGDGFADIVVGAPGSSSNGRIAVFNGGTFGIQPLSSFGPTGSVATGEEFGTSVASAGDVNGDGFADLIVGAPFFPNPIPGFTGRGRATIFFGSASGLQHPALPPFQAGPFGAEQRAGMSVASAGDVNGDGFGDVIIGVPDPSGTGVAEVLLGGSSGPVGSPITLMGDNIASLFGTSVASAGDVNGDGFGDVIVGAPNRLQDVGAAFIFFGTATGVNVASPLFIGGTPGAHFGTVVASAGDLDSDLFGDIAVASGLGNVTVFRHGSLFGEDPAQVLIGETVASAGDVDNDGYGDLIIGQPSIGANGQAVLMMGSFNGLVPSAVWSATDNQSSHFGRSVASAGDVNGDGFADLVVGATNMSGTGHAFVYLGDGAANDGTQQTRSSPSHLRALRAGSSIPLAPGDVVPGNSFDLNLGVASQNTSFRAKVQVEVKPFNQKFDELGLVSSPTWLNPGSSGFVTLNGVSVPPGEPFHYRARLLFDANQPVGTQRGPWIYGGLPGQPSKVHLRGSGRCTICTPPRLPPRKPSPTSSG